MSIDLNLPLEVNRPREYPNITNPRLIDGEIIVNYSDDEYDTLRFDATTGVLIGQQSSDNPMRLRNKSEEVAVKFFRIWFGHKDWTKADWRYLQDDTKYQFDDGKSAKAKADELNKESADADAPWRFMVKSHTVMSPNHKWREWMQARFDSGEYAPLPWADEPWYNKDHFAHNGIADPFKVAFVESIVNGAEDKMTVLNPGRYLERFYSDHLNPQEIAAWAAKADSESELGFAVTGDEMVDIYVNGGIDSCMKYAEDSPQFPLGVHPVRAYAAGDLQLAYLKRRDKLVARALVWPEHKRVGRIYGDSERLKNALAAEGYTFTDGDRNTFDGAKLKRIEVDGEIVMPYLDWQMGANEVGDGEHLVITGNRNARATYKGQTTNGTASGRVIHICGHNGCRTRMEESAGFYNSATGRQMCASCADATLVTCVLTHENYPLEGHPSAHMVQVMSRDGVTPFPGFRGGWIRRESVRSGYGDNRYVLIDNIVYPMSETEQVGRNRRPLPALA